QQEDADGATPQTVNAANDNMNLPTLDHLKQGTNPQAAQPDAASVAAAAAQAVHKADDAAASANGKANDLRSDLPFQALLAKAHAGGVSEQVLVKIEKALEQGTDRITIRLEPPELGRVHVSMDVGQDGKTHVVIAADNKLSLDLLQQDGRALERA